MALLIVEEDWLRWLLEDLGVSVTTPTPLINQYMCYQHCAQPLKHELTKHNGVEASFVRSGVWDKVILFSM